MTNLKDVCWQLFVSSGNISYYLLYKSLEEKSE